MSEKLKTLFSVDPTFVKGEQPTDVKFTVLHGLAKSGFAKLENLLGPLEGEGEKIVSEVASGEDLFEDRSLEDTEHAIFNFNIARLLGPANILNPVVLGGEVVFHEAYTTGFPLEANKTEWVLPFRPADPENSESFVFSDTTTFNNIVASLEELKESGQYYVDSTGRLYSVTIPSSDSTVKYTYTTDRGTLYSGAGYNCIPDLSILSLSEGERLALTKDGTLGFLEVSYNEDESTTDVAAYNITLPYIISGRYNPLGSNEDYPALTDNCGLAELDGESERFRYRITGNNFTELEYIANNKIILYDYLNDVGYQGVFKKESGDSRLICYLSKATEARFLNDGDDLLIEGGQNTHQFFLFLTGATLFETVYQLAIDSNMHAHDGKSSRRISHKDLKDASFLKSGLPTEEEVESVSFGLTNTEDNVHPQFLHRKGYRYGGKHGEYTNVRELELYQSTHYSDLNMLEGDLVLGPINFVDPETGEVDTDESATLNMSVLPEELAGSDSRSIIFGQPFWDEDMDTFGAGFGATRLYYSADLLEEGDDNWHSFEVNGLPLGNLTSARTANRKRGLNITWGNLFFGYKENLNGGEYDGAPSHNERDNSAAWKTSEFIVFCSGNGNAGTNTNVTAKYDGTTGIGNRDGFLTRAIKGASVYLGVGGSENDSVDNILDGTGVNGTGTTGSITLEAALSLGRVANKNDNSGLWSTADVDVHEQQAGSAILMSPGLGGSRIFPWQNGLGSSGVGEKYGIYTNAQFPETAIGKGGWLHLMSKAPKLKTQAPNELYTENDGPLEKPYGRMLFEGTRSIDFLVDSVVGNIVGPDPYDGPPANSGVSGFSFSVSKLEDSVFNHPEVRFWGQEDISLIDDDYSNVENVVGTNLNLNKGYLQQYNGRGTVLDWEDNSRHGITDNPIMSSRALQVGSAYYPDYGSNIRNAGFIDAFGGLRGDPNDPFYVDVVVPFKARRKVSGSAEVGSGLTEVQLSTFYLLSFEEDSAFLLSYRAFPGDDSQLSSVAVGGKSSVDAFGSKVFIDQIIREYDSLLALRCGSNALAPGDSLIDCEVSLDYFGIDDGSGNFTTLTSGPQYFTELSTATPKIMKSIKSNFDDANVKVIGTKGFVDFNSGSTFYDSSIKYNTNVVIVDVDQTEFLARVGNTHTNYLSLFKNSTLGVGKQFGLRVNFQTPVASNSKEFPYKLYIGDTNGTPASPGASAFWWQEIQGFIRFKFKTLDFTTSVNDLEY